MTCSPLGTGKEEERAFCTMAKGGKYLQYSNRRQKTKQLFELLSFRPNLSFCHAKTLKFYSICAAIHVHLLKIGSLSDLKWRFHMDSWEAGVEVVILFSSVC
ncbi:hypothetical protein MRB53_027972 [Persea americana]|uniref:Uncharacterized protein n=1 Tax=Persea americana TaxID=3435 RepID=A0ACC2KED6_PERAE|nr:hypothetical protein MRB53_027972 [Persea americana]